MLCSYVAPLLVSYSVFLLIIAYFHSVYTALYSPQSFTDEPIRAGDGFGVPLKDDGFGVSLKDDGLGVSLKDDAGGAGGQTADLPAEGPPAEPRSADESAAAGDYLLTTDNICIPTL